MQTNFAFPYHAVSLNAMTCTNSIFLPTGIRTIIISHPGYLVSHILAHKIDKNSTFNNKKVNGNCFSIEKLLLLKNNVSYYNSFHIEWC